VHNTALIEITRKKIVGRFAYYPLATLARETCSEQCCDVPSSEKKKSIVTLAENKLGQNHRPVFARVEYTAKNIVPLQTPS
jgi:hypothetical protein